MKNPLIDHANLFATGNFYIKGESNHWHPEYKSNCIFEFTAARFLDLELSYSRHDPKKCTLVARRIDDMTDNEVRNCPGYDKDQFTISRYKKWLKISARLKNLVLDVTVYLLSIGVYIFDQSHFEDGIIIDIRQI